MFYFLFHIDRFIDLNGLCTVAAAILRFHAKTKFESLKKWRENNYHQREIYRIFCCAFIRVRRGNRNVGQMEIAQNTDSELEKEGFILVENQSVYWYRSLLSQA